MIILFEIPANQIKRDTLYSYCRRYHMNHFKDINENFYYVRLDNEGSYVLFRKYLENKNIEFSLFFKSI